MIPQIKGDQLALASFSLAVLNKANISSFIWDAMSVPLPVIKYSRLTPKYRESRKALLKGGIIPLDIHCRNLSKDMPQAFAASFCVTAFVLSNTFTLFQNALIFM